MKQRSSRASHRNVAPNDRATVAFRSARRRHTMSVRARVVVAMSYVNTRCPRTASCFVLQYASRGADDLDQRCLSRGRIHGEKTLACARSSHRKRTFALRSTRVFKSLTPCRSIARSRVGFDRMRDSKIGGLHRPFVRSRQRIRVATASEKIFANLVQLAKKSRQRTLDNTKKSPCRDLRGVRLRNIFDPNQQHRTVSNVVDDLVDVRLKGARRDALKMRVGQTVDGILGGRSKPLAQPAVMRQRVKATDLGVSTRLAGDGRTVQGTARELENNLSHDNLLYTLPGTSPRRTIFPYPRPAAGAMGRESDARRLFAGDVARPGRG